MAAPSKLLIRTKQGPEHDDSFAMPSPELFFVELQCARPNTQPDARWHYRPPIWHIATFCLGEMVQGSSFEFKAKDTLHCDVATD